MDLFLQFVFIFQVTMKTTYLVILFLKILALSSGMKHGFVQQSIRRSKSSLGSRKTNFNHNDLRTTSSSTQQREVFFVNLEDGKSAVCLHFANQLFVYIFEQILCSKPTVWRAGWLEGWAIQPSHRPLHNWWSPTLHHYTKYKCWLSQIMFVYIF